MRMRKVKKWTRRSTGAWTLPLVPDSDEAGHTILGVPVRSLSSITKDFASASSQDHLQVFAIHSRLRPLVLRIFFDASWVLRHEFCRVSVG
jgi:hypothetical protein